MHGFAKWGEFAILRDPLPFVNTSEGVSVSNSPEGETGGGETPQIGAFQFGLSAIRRSPMGGMPTAR